VIYFNKYNLIGSLLPKNIYNNNFGNHLLVVFG